MLEFLRQFILGLPLGSWIAIGLAILWIIYVKKSKMKNPLEWGWKRRKKNE